MKKKLLIMLLTIISFASLFVVTLLASADEDVNDEVVNELNELLNYYYDDGTYTKHTKLYVDTEKVKEEISSYFHASVTDVERTTYYDGDALWMSRGPEGEGVKYSYYGTHYVDGVAKGVTSATTNEPLVQPENPRVVLSGEGKNSMNEYYVTLDDIFATALEGWQKDADGVYSTDNKAVLDDFRNFVAPLWLHTEKSANYLDFTLATVEEKDNTLLLKLWVSAAEAEGKLHASEIKGDNALFSVADIKAPYIIKKVTADVGTYEESGVHYSIDKMFDGKLDTFAWFTGQPSEVVIELSKEIMLTSLDIYQTSGWTSGGGSTDMMAATIEVSTNGVDYTPIGKLEYRDYTYLYLETPVAAKYIRLNEVDTGTWVAIREVLINQVPNVTLNGFKPYQHEMKNAFDGNPETYVHIETVGTQKDCGMVLDYGQIVTFNTLNVMTAPEGGDCFWGFKASYSVDGITYYDLVEVSLEHEDVRNYTHQTPSLINARYIKIDGLGDVTNWLQLYEISLSITDFVPAPTVTLNGFKPYLNDFENAFDGDPETYVHIQTVGTQKDCGIVIDYGQIVTFNTLNVMTAPEGGDCFWGFKASYSVDGITYYDLVEVTADHADVRNYTHQTTSLINARYIKLDGLGDVTNWLQVHEISISVADVVGVKPVFAEVENGLVFNGFVDKNGFAIAVDPSLYSVHYSDDNGSYEELPTNPGWYSLVVNLVENSGLELIDGQYPHASWKVFEVKNIQKVNPEVSFSIKNGATLYIGVDGAPTVSVTEGVEYEVFYTMNDGAINLGSEFPTTPGTYAINIQTMENDGYNAYWNFRWFKLEEAPTEEIIKVKLVTRYDENQILVVDGFVDAEGNRVIIDESLYGIWYEKSEVKTSPEDFVAGESYRLIVDFVAGANYEFIIYDGYVGNANRTWPKFTYNPVVE